MFERDLIYICKHVDEWPNECYAIRLDSDGEVCFIGSDFKDFYPEGQLSGEVHLCFVSCGDAVVWGENYLKEDFLKCKEYLANRNNSVDDGTDPVIEKVKLRMQDITKRHEQALADELKPLIEVLQRRGEIL